MKTISIAIVTWPIIPERIGGFIDCVDRLRSRMVASRHELIWVASSESRDVEPDMRESLQRFCDTAGIRLQFRPGPNDLGANMNAAMKMAPADYCLVVQDDMALTGEGFDVSDAADFLDLHPDFACVRFGWAHTTFTGIVDGFQEVNMHGSYPYADEPSLWRGGQLPNYIEGAGHGAQEGDLCYRLIGQRARIAATMAPQFTHGHVPSCIKERRPA